MADYDRKILNALLDSYENSVLSRGENKVSVRIAFRFTKRSIPEYFDESSTEYEAIHACIDNLSGKGFLSDIDWKNGVPGHIVQKVYLNEERTEEVYAYLGRTPRRMYEVRQLELLGRLAGECVIRPAEQPVRDGLHAELPAVISGGESGDGTGTGNPASPESGADSVTGTFIAWLSDRIRQHLPVKEYIELSDRKGTEQLVRCVWYVETNTVPCYVREFSIMHFGDSKTFEAIRSRAHKVFIRFGRGLEEADEKELFAEYGIYDTPNYVYLKGEGSLRIGGDEIPLRPLRQGIGISGEDLETVQVSGTDDTHRIITIENLTTFFRMQEDDALIIYLGGYHNRTRRRLLSMIHEQLPDAQYLHFGDIDAGGFAIYEDLCRKTGIPFTPYRMGIAELEQYGAYAKKLTASDRRRLQLMLDRPPAHLDAYRSDIEYMLRHDIKLEQECILAGS